MITIKKISIGSAFKVAAVVSTLLWLVFGLLLVLLPSSALEVNTSFRDGDFIRTLDRGSLFISYLCGLPLQAVLGGLAGAFIAFAYNVTAGWIGGLQVEVQDDRIIGPHSSEATVDSRAYRPPQTEIEMQRLQQARVLTQNGQLKEAHAILRDMPNNPTARRWREAIEAQEPALRAQAEDSGKPRSSGDTDDWSPVRFDQ
ncbi:MAG: hypothetical protein ACOCX3_00330 [Chloroflexota bacterium]